MNRKKLFIIIGGILIVLIVIIIFIASGGKSTDTLSIKSVTLSKTVNADNEATEPTTIFSTQDQTINAVIDFGFIAGGETTQRKWIDLQTGNTIKLEKRGGQRDFSGKSLSTINREEALLAVGSYEFQVVYNGRIIEKRDFVIKTPYEISKENISSTVKSVTLTKSVDIRGNAKSENISVFDEKDQDIYASIVYSGVSSPSAFEGRWIFVDQNKLLKNFQKTLSGSGVFAFGISTDRDSTIPIDEWEKGDYRLEVYINGDKIKDVLFSIQ